MMSQQRPLPPGVDSTTLDEFFDHTSKMIGQQNISRDPSSGALPGPQGQQSYGDPFYIVREHTPSGAVRPRSVEEVQFVVKTANKYKIPLWTVSRGKNLGYGGSSPVVDGSVVLDLQRMNKIVKINEEYAYAVVEPGVSFLDLYETVKQRGLNLWPSCPALGWGSIVGNTLERGFGYTPNGEHSESQCGLEVVLPTGELIRTGMGAMEESKLFPLHKGGYGPSVDGLFFQSNFGIVTKLGIHITPAPEAYMRCEVSAPNEGDLVPLVGTLTDLLRRGIIGNSPSVTNLTQQLLASKDPDVAEKLAPHVGKNRPVPNDVLEEIRSQKKMHYWKALFSLYGTLEVVPAQFKSIQRAIDVIPGARVTSTFFSSSPGQHLKATDVGEDGVIPQSGIPTLAGLDMLGLREQGNKFTVFSPVVPPSGRELYDWYLIAKQRTADLGFNFIADFHLYARYIIATNLFTFTATEQDRIDSLCRKLLEDGARLGYTEYRTHLRYMEDVAAHLNFNDGALRRYTSALKDAMDPNGILSPGKCGVWNSGRNSKQTAPKVREEENLLL